MGGFFYENIAAADLMRAVVFGVYITKTVKKPRNWSLLVYLQYGNPDSILFYRYWLLQSIVFIIHVCGQLPMVTRMKNHTDVLIFYMAVCAGAPQIAVMAEEKPFSLISLRTIAHGAPECGLR